MVEIIAFEIDSNILAAASAIITLIAAYFIGNIVKQAVINISEKSGIRQKVRFGIQKEDMICHSLPYIERQGGSTHFYKI